MNRKDVRTSFNHLLVSFLFVFQNDNDLIDNDNAGQSPAAQAVVLTFSLTYYLILTLFRFSFGCTICVQNLTTLVRFVLNTYCKSFPDLFTDLHSNIFIKISYYYSRKKENLLQHIIYFFFCKITLFTVQLFLFHFSHTLSRGTHDGCRKMHRAHAKCLTWRDLRITSFLLK